MLRIEYRALSILLVCGSILAARSLRKSEISSIDFVKSTNQSNDNSSRGKISNSSRGFELETLFEVWNPRTVARLWYEPDFEKSSIDRHCRDDLTRYIEAVQDGENWALKMVDAAGRYSWGLFWGSRYWMGAPDLCREMENEFDVWKKNEKSELRSDDIPPYRVHVNSITFILDILKPGINGTHKISMGLCLPASCSIRDIDRLLHVIKNHTDTELPRNLTIDHIRNLSHGYSFFDDPIFYTLLVTFVTVLALVIIGTIYDVILRYRVLRNEFSMRKTRNVMRETKIFQQDDSRDDEITLSKLWAVNNHNGSLDCNSKNEPKPLSEAFLSFSMLLNISKLGSMDVGSDTLAPVHGLRFLSILWVILVHTCLFVNEISDNRMFRKKSEEDFLYQTLSNGTYAVDTFFVLSGALVAFLYFRTIKKDRIQEKSYSKGFGGRVLQFFGMMWYRYFRLTPPYLLCIGIITVSMKWYHDHALMELPTLDYKTCEKYWWRHALYINTYFPKSERCMDWSWYLANDTQFYTIGIIILIVGASCFSAAVSIGIFLLLASWITTAVITLNVHHIPSIQDPFAHYESLYDKPWTRLGPYLIGMATGWYLSKIDCRLKINKIALVVGWTLSGVTMMSIIYGLYGTRFGPVLSAAYTALSHSGWALSVAWVLVACVTGHGGIVDKLLSWKCLYPFSRLTYCAYLLHPILTRSMILQGESSYHLTQGYVAFLYFGVVLVSYMAAFVVSLMFEAPVVSLMRIVHPMRRWK